MRPLWLTLLICAWLLVLPRPWTERILVENGPIEMPTAIAYFIAAILLWSVSSRQWKRAIPATLLLIAGGLRELDFQARFTTGYAFSSGYFLRQAAPLQEKIIVGAVLLLLGMLFMVLLSSNWRVFVHALQSGQSWARSVALAIGFMLASTSLDECAGCLRSQYWGVEDAVFLMWVFEETFEAMIPVLFAVAIVQSAILPAVERRHAA